MTVENLIKKLQEFDPKLPVAVYVGVTEDGNWCEEILLETKEKETLYYKGDSIFFIDKNYDSAVVIKGY